MKNFSLTIKDALVIKTDGFYKYIRHPSYIGSMIMFLGLILISVHVALLYLVFIFFLARALQEEYILSNNKEYLEYIKRTGMFLPKIKREP